MKIGLLQCNSGRDAVANIAMLEPMLAALRGSDLIVTPECTNLMGYRPRTDSLATLDHDPVVRSIREFARENKQLILIGSALLDDGDGNAVNRQLLIDAKGGIQSHYDKIHMFDVDLPSGESYRESDRFKAGQDVKISNFDTARIGHSICFDLRFPLLYRMLAQAGANVIMIPAAFTATTGRAHWEVLLRARAIETTSYVIAPGQCGQYPHHDGTSRETWGHSMVISPWGEIIAQLGDTPATKIVEIPLDAVEKTRAQIPSLSINPSYMLTK